jgi:glutamine synthetase
LHEQIPSGASINEAEDFLGQYPDIDTIDVVLVDPNGMGRGKMIRRHELLSLYREGRHVPGSILGLDVTGEDVEETGLVWHDGGEDQIVWPIPGTLKPLTFTAPVRGQVIVSMYDLNGAPNAADPRHALLRQLGSLAQRGLRPAAAFELEFFLFAAERDSDGLPQSAPATLDGRPSNGRQVYALEELDGMQALFGDIYAAAEAQDLPLESLISEYAPGQYELTLRYREDITRAADDLVILKRLVRGVARRHGIMACFMAKPLPRHAGSGMHLHLSMLDGERSNVFAEPQLGQLSAPLRHAIGGVLTTMPESMLIFAPHANSWRRFAAKSYAPVAPTWGFNNRSVAIRVPAGPAAARRFEHRVAGVDANPYLIGATVLAGLSAGLNLEIDPGAPTIGNGYEAVDRAKSAMPRDWRSAIETARTSDFLRGALGETLHRAFIAIKQAELFRVESEVSELEYRLYFDSI